MSQDLLLAVGSRIEARLKAKDSRPHAATDVGTAIPGASQPTTFTLLEDTKPVSFQAPDAAPAASLPPTMERADEPAFSAAQLDLVAKAQAMAISMAISSASASASASAAPAIVIDHAAPTTGTEHAAPTMASESAAPASSYGASTDAASAVPAYTPPVPAYTPPVPAEFGVGATFGRFAGDTPMTVTRLGDGVVFAMYTDSEGTREVAFHPTQLSLITAAP